MDYKAYLTSWIRENEKSQAIHKECLQREQRCLEELKEEHTVLEGLIQAMGDTEKAWNPIRKSKKTEFSKKNRIFEITVTVKKVCNMGVFVNSKFYSSDKLKDYMGMEVLVTYPCNGKIQVFSLDGEFLTNAFIRRN